jgi:uncharacterized phage protein gp47/JayE
MAGLTDEGFENKRLSEILSDLITDGYNDYDLDTSDSAVVGRLIRLISPSIADCWEATQQVYDSRNPSTATGVNLDEVVANAGISRRDESYSTSPVMLTGDVNLAITSDRQISNTIGDEFTITSDVVLSRTSCSKVGVEVNSVVSGASYTLTAIHSNTTETFSYVAGGSDTSPDILNGLATQITSNSANYSGEVLNDTLWFSRDDEFQLVSYSSTSNLAITKVGKIGTVQANEVGAIQVTADTLINISNSISGWDSVTNPTDGSEGGETETDTELRQRFFTSRNATAQNTNDAIYSNLLAIDGVLSALVRENTTDTVNGDGLLPHSINVVIRGGNSSEIAQTIWTNKAGGIALNGSTEVEITDSQGNIQTIKFDRPTNIPIFISMTITDDGSFADDGEQQIKDAISAYFDSNYGVGDDIIYSRLYTPINSIGGFQVDDLSIGTLASPTETNNIAIADDEIGVTFDANIVITVLT